MIHRHRSISAALMAAALGTAACESATPLSPRTTPAVENAPATAEPVAAGSGAFAGARASFGAQVRGGGRPIFVAGSGPAVPSLVRVSKSGGYTDASGRVVSYEFRDSVRAVNLAFALDGAQSGGGLTLVIPGDLPAPGTYTVLGSTDRPPYDLSRALFVSYGSRDCAFTWVGESGTLAVLRSSSGGMEGEMDVRLRAVQRGAFITPGPGAAGVECGPITGVAGAPETLELFGSFTVEVP